MSGIVCPKCNAYLGLDGTNANQCLKCGAPLMTTKKDDVQEEDDNRNVRHERFHKIGTGCLMLFGGFAISMAVSAGVFSSGGMNITIWGLFLFGATRLFDGLLGNTPLGKARKKKRSKNPTLTDRCVKRTMRICMVLGSLGCGLYGWWDGASIGLIVFAAVLGLVGGVLIGLILGLASALGGWLFRKPSASEPVLNLIAEETDGNRFTQR